MAEIIEEYEARGNLWQLKEGADGTKYSVKVGSGENKKSPSAFYGAKEAQTNAPDQFEQRVIDGRSTSARTGYARDHDDARRVREYEQADMSAIGSAAARLRNGEEIEDDETFTLPESGEEISGERMKTIIRNSAGGHGLFRYVGE